MKIFIFKYLYLFMVLCLISDNSLLSTNYLRDITRKEDSRTITYIIKDPKNNNYTISCTKIKDEDSISCARISKNSFMVTFMDKKDSKELYEKLESDYQLQEDIEVYLQVKNL